MQEGYPLLSLLEWCTEPLLVSDATHPGVTVLDLFRPPQIGGDICRQVNSSRRPRDESSLDGDGKLAMVDKLTKEGACNGLIVKVVPNDDIMSSISIEPDRSVRNGHVISVFSSFCKRLGRLAGAGGTVVDIELSGPLTDAVMNLDVQILEASVVFYPLNGSR